MTRSIYQPRHYALARQKRARLGIYVTRDVHARLRREARAKGITISHLIVRDYLRA